ncbi:MAG TPA: type IV conjugative transfer system protein TraE [Burkholderiaceae bacterium]|nr:type IV conjugative transfer system protein TraE [Burkholderiaceae bacterium]
MKWTTFVSDIEARLAIRRVLIYALFASIATNVALATYVATSTKDWRVELVVPPGVERSFWVQRDDVSGDYLEMMATHVIGLALNVSAATVDGQTKALLRLVAPSAYGEVQKMMEVNAMRLKTTSSATTFWPAEILTDAHNKTVTFRGMQSTWIADRRTSQVDRTFVVRFAYTGGRLVVVELSEHAGKPGQEAAHGRASM